jgi:chaperonin GroES
VPGRVDLEASGVRGEREPGRDRDENLHEGRLDTSDHPLTMRPARFTPDGGTKTMAAKVRPLHNRLIVQRVQDEEKTRGGIIIPDTAKEKPTEGKVIAAGPGKRDEKGNLVAMDVKKGDRVLFSKYGGSEVTLDGEDYLIVSEDEVLAVLE